MQMIENAAIHGISHITGGGLPGNVVRMLGDGRRAVIDSSAWTRPEIFDWIETNGNVSREEMWKTFNCGVGLVVATPESQVDAVMDTLAALDQTAWIIGQVESGDRSVEILT
jgi:phosphoribosylformylglycinamidine cyclo-ligase